jgi:adenosylcobinamide kinase / adenosylcobinamide-phosphate guanylyltransferase
MIELILGGARSGKSSLAEQRATDSGLAVTYIATAEAATSAGDSEMAARIAHHAARRPSHWGLVEEPLYLATTLRKYAAPDRLLLVDCLTLWLSNLLFFGVGEAVEPAQQIDCALLREQTQALVDCLPTLPGHIILVSNEVGLGIIPMGAITRLYVDEAGRLNQRIAQVCDHVTFVAAGLPLELKQP